MAHHQHYGAEHLSTSPQSIISRPRSTTMPLISEDELAAEADEPPEQQPNLFKKTTPASYQHKESLLTRALHNDSDSHDNEPPAPADSVKSFPSRSSTASTQSMRSTFTSDDGLTSPGTMASSPHSPPAGHLFTKPDFKKAATYHHAEEPSASSITKTVSPSETSEPQVEAQLGRKRCISFFCGGRKDDNPTEKTPEKTTAGSEVKDAQPEPPKRACTIKFACPSKIFSRGLDKEQRPATSEKPSPTPRSEPETPIAARKHRDSDSTLKPESPRSARRSQASSPASTVRPKQADDDDDLLGKTEATRFHEFATSEDETVEDWMQESTVPRSRLTVDDTLQKELSLRQIGEEAENEAIEEEDEEAALDDDLSDDEVSDGGFQTDDEEGFAESDDDSDGDSDFEWWAPRRRHRRPNPTKEDALARLPSGGGRRPDLDRRPSDSSINEALSQPKFTRSPLPGRKSSKSIAIRPKSPELPDSTDFVCGTLDEDQPLQQAYISHLEHRRAAQHRAKPQDIDPTFPTSDPEDEEDEEDDEDLVPNNDEEQVDDDDDDDDDDDGIRPISELAQNVDSGEAPRGRTLTRDGSPAPSSGRIPSPVAPVTAKKVTPNRSPAPPASSTKKPTVHRSPPPPACGLKRVQTNRSPAPVALSTKKTPVHRSPPPGAPYGLKRTNTNRSPAPTKRLFGHSPVRGRSPHHAHRITSPPPSRRTSTTRSKPISFTQAFLAEKPQLTHTTSLTRPPAPFLRRHSDYHEDSTNMATPRQGNRRQSMSPGSNDDDEDTACEDNKPNMAYTRGAIDIVQGLEKKRLKRREKFYEKYTRKCDRKFARGEAPHKRPAPGKGAERMRQVGLECAIYRGQRMLSI